MAVMGLLMPVAGLIKVRYGEKADIDSPFFKLHYRTTATVLFISCILVTANDLIGSTIDCIGGVIPGNVLNTYCWIMSTFSVPAKSMTGKGNEYAYAGVEPYIEGKSERTLHAYYQWVPFVLFLQGILFYLPHWLWKIFEDRKMQKITNGLLGRTLDIKDRSDKCSELVRYVTETFHTHNAYALKYFICDLLNFINVIGQMYLINVFLGGVFLTYGTDVLKWSESEPEDRTDPMIDVFPRVTKCTFHKYGPSGTIERHDAMCVLALNIINEKIYVALWFWFIILAVLTALYLLYVLAVISVPSMRKVLVERNAKNEDLKQRIDPIMKKAQMGDWFLIFLLSKNMDSVLFNDFVCKLCEKLKTDSPHLHATAQDELIWDTDPSQVLLQAESDANDNIDEDEPLLHDEEKPSDIEMGIISKPTPPHSPSGDDSGSGKSPERLYPTAPTDDITSSDGSTASAHSTEV